jgi:hypothetical protein
MKKENISYERKIKKNFRVLGISKNVRSGFGSGFQKILCVGFRVEKRPGIGLPGATLVPTAPNFEINLTF